MPLTSPRIPCAPQNFDQHEFFQNVDWHQKWQLFEGIFTPGSNSIEQMWADLRLPHDLSGKRVLDIGAWNGCLSFECERRGASEVIALSPEDPNKTGFYKLHVILKSQNVHYVIGTVYDLNPRKLGYFDVVLFCGVLYHLRYPLLGIDNIRRISRGDVYIETLVSDPQLMVKQRGKLKTVPMADISPMLSTAALWQFYRKSELNADPSNWFGPNCTAVVQAFESAGFETSLLKQGGRATFHAKAKQGPPEFLTIGTTEGVYYDTVCSPLFGDGDDLWMTKDRTWSFSEQFLVMTLSSKEYYQKKGGNDHAWIDALYENLIGAADGPAKSFCRFEGHLRTPMLIVALSWST